MKLNKRIHLSVVAKATEVGTLLTLRGPVEATISEMSNGLSKKQEVESGPDLDTFNKRGDTALKYIPDDFDKREGLKIGTQLATIAPEYTEEEVEKVLEVVISNIKGNDYMLADLYKEQLLQLAKLKFPELDQEYELTLNNILISNSTRQIDLEDATHFRPGNWLVISAADKYVIVYKMPAEKINGGETRLEREVMEAWFRDDYMANLTPFTDENRRRLLEFYDSEVKRKQAEENK